MNGTDVTPILVARHLAKTYSGRAGRLAADDISLDLEEGGSLGIVGESGSGKTTVAKMLVGLERPSAGQTLIDGIDHTVPPRGTRARRRRARDIQMVFQDPYTSLDRHQRVGDCLAEALKLHFGLSRAELTQRVHKLADLAGIDDRQLRSLPEALSGGQRQRVAIARALATEPKIVVLDESVAALDVSIQAQILNLLADIRERTNVSYVVISHDLAVIRQITDHTVVMHRGQRVEHGPTNQVLDTPQQDYTRQLRDSVPRPGWTPRSRQESP